MSSWSLPRIVGVRPFSSAEAPSAERSVPASGIAPRGFVNIDQLVKPAVKPITRIAGPTEGNPDSDPMRHIEYLASKELLGRGSPSPGLDKAGAYVADLMKRYGMEGANPSDPSGNPFFQTFDLWSLRGEPRRHLAKNHKWGRSLFEGGFYLDATLTEEERATIKKSCRSNGVGLKGLELTPDGLKKAGLAAAKVQNVVGIMRGTGPQKDEYIVVMAHLDHLGGTPDRFFPGASDNASGSATNISTIPQLAQLQKEGKLNRSVLVILTAAEEKGLVGANYFLKHPTVPLEKIKGSINNDMVGRFEVDRISVIDTTKTRRTFLTDAFAYANDKLGDRKFTTVNRDLQSFENRQDNWAFTKAGIITSFIFEGLTNPKGGGGENPDYHKTTDTPDKIIKENGGEKVRRLRDLTVHMVEFASNAKL